ncbi:hypothetical protein ABT336_13025 [Micromonospora sp. NPDC000207]|uniref:hypothetical protein n=1 Tax=Micromonospora sp. NPDC000207 TaxID=3154246 RepID=UPI003321E150
MRPPLADGSFVTGGRPLPVDGSSAAEGSSLVAACRGAVQVVRARSGAARPPVASRAGTGCGGTGCGAGWTAAGWTAAGWTGVGRTAAGWTGVGRTGVGWSVVNGECRSTGAFTAHGEASSGVLGATGGGG